MTGWLWTAVKAIVDADVVAYLLLRTEAFVDESRACFERLASPLAPAHWEAELANVVWMAVKAGVLSAADGPTCLGLARRLGIESIATSSLSQGRSCVPSNPDPRLRHALCRTGGTLRVPTGHLRQGRAEGLPGYRTSPSRSRGALTFARRPTGPRRLRWVAHGHRRNGSNQNAIGLCIAPHHEHVCADIDEVALPVERLCALVALPHSEPQRSSIGPAGFRIDALHQRLREATTVPLPGEVEPPQFDRRVAIHARRRWPAPELCVSNELTVGVDEQRRDVGICQLSTLLERAVRLSQMEGHVFGLAVRGERVVKRAGCQVSETGRVRRNPAPNRDVHVDSADPACPPRHPRRRDITSTG